MSTHIVISLKLIFHNRIRTPVFKDEESAGVPAADPDLRPRDVHPLPPGCYTVCPRSLVRVYLVSLYPAYNISNYDFTNFKMCKTTIQKKRKGKR